jgi:hypothetical protein
MTTGQAFGELWAARAAMLTISSWEEFAAEGGLISYGTNIDEVNRLLVSQDRSAREDDMDGAGNIYRHNYEDVAAQHVWDAVQIDLPPLRVVIERELAALDP